MPTGNNAKDGVNVERTENDMDLVHTLNSVDFMNVNDSVDLQNTEINVSLLSSGSGVDLQKRKGKVGALPSYSTRNGVKSDKTRNVVEMKPIKLTGTTMGLASSSQKTKNNALIREKTDSDDAGNPAPKTSTTKSNFFLYKSKDTSSGIYSFCNVPNNDVAESDQMSQFSHEPPISCLTSGFSTRFSTCPDWNNFNSAKFETLEEGGTQNIDRFGEKNEVLQKQYMENNEMFVFERNSANQELDATNVTQLEYSEYSTLTYLNSGKSFCSRSVHPSECSEVTGLESSDTLNSVYELGGWNGQDSGLEKGWIQLFGNSNEMSLSGADLEGKIDNASLSKTRHVQSATELMSKDLLDADFFQPSNGSSTEGCDDSFDQNIRFDPFFYDCSDPLLRCASPDLSLMLEDFFDFDIQSVLSGKPSIQNQNL